MPNKARPGRPERPKPKDSLLNRETFQLNLCCSLSSVVGMLSDLLCAVRYSRDSFRSATFVSQRIFCHISSKLSLIFFGNTKFPHFWTDGANMVTDSISHFYLFLIRQYYQQQNPLSDTRGPQTPHFVQLSS